MWSKSERCEIHINVNSQLWMVCKVCKVYLLRMAAFRPRCRDSSSSPRRGCTASAIPALCAPKGALRTSLCWAAVSRADRVNSDGATALVCFHWRASLAELTQQTLWMAGSQVVRKSLVSHSQDACKSSSFRWFEFWVLESVTHSTTGGWRGFEDDHPNDERFWRFRTRPGVARLNIGACFGWSFEKKKPGNETEERWKTRLVDETCRRDLETCKQERYRKMIWKMELLE